VNRAGRAANGRRGAQPSLRLFCLPYAGGSARIFRDWAESLPEFVQVRPLELAGRGQRYREDPMGELEPLMRDLLSTVLPHTGTAFSILGYGYGALLGFELAKRLEHEYGTKPQRLFVAAMRAPIWPRCPNPLSALPDAQLRGLLRGSENLLPDRADATRFVMRVLRADLSVAESYRPGRGPWLTCPVTAFRGAQDAAVSPESLQAWCACTSGAFNCWDVPGGHFFLRAAHRLLLDLISAELSGRQCGRYQQQRGVA
jgi:medium-chain acyl-[acyl-carrier-protein] hydrolase